MIEPGLYTYPQFDASRVLILVVADLGDVHFPSGLGRLRRVLASIDGELPEVTYMYPHELERVL